MSEQILIHGLRYATYGIEAVVCVLLVRSGRWGRLKGVWFYVSALLLLDGLGREAVLNYFGLASHEYRYFYWLTDVALALGAFLLICSFFRRACAQEEKLWRFARSLLIFSFVIVLAISILFITRNYTHLFTDFIIEFSQNLYFTCLVLDTLLYVMIQQLSLDDDELGLLVCGFGVQFAGEAACFALLHLTFGDSFSTSLLVLSSPVCTFGMLAIWAYAVTKKPQTVPSRFQPRKVEALAGARVGS